MKKWQEIEFLDYKERQIRRRTQKSRAIQIELEKDPPSKGLRVVAVTAVLLVVCGVGGFTYWQHREELRAQELAHRVELSISDVKGDVEYSTATTPFAPLKSDVHPADAFTVRQQAGARVTVVPALGRSRLVVVDKSQVEIAKPHFTDQDPADRLYLNANVKSGTLMCEFRTGDPRLEIKLPSGVLIYGGTGLYKVVVDDKGATVLVRDGRLKVSKADKSKATAVKVDERLVISASGDWERPANFPTPETVWK